jgi:hypothetical protein
MMVPFVIAIVIASFLLFVLEDDGFCKSLEKVYARIAKKCN